MGRSENSGAIAVIVIAIVGGLLLLLMLAGVAAMFFVGVRSASPPPVAVATTTNLKTRLILVEADTDGSISVNGTAYTDEEFRAFLDEEVAHSDEAISIEYVFSDDISAERQAEIQAIYDEVASGEHHE